MSTTKTDLDAVTEALRARIGEPTGPSFSRPLHGFQWEHAKPAPGDVASDAYRLVDVHLSHDGYVCVDTRWGVDISYRMVTETLPMNCALPAWRTSAPLADLVNACNEIMVSP